MTQLTVWVFRAPTGARDAADRLGLLAARGNLDVQDGALVEWTPGESSPQARQLDELAGPRALGVTFWDMLFGLVFLFPLLADATDGSSSPVWSSLGAAGIQDTVLEEIRARVVPGTSALCLLSADEAADILAEAWRDDGGPPVVAVLDDQRQRALLQVFPR